MFINKWLVKDSVQQLGTVNKSTGICFQFRDLPGGAGDFIRIIQQQFWEIPFTMLLPKNLDFQPEAYPAAAETVVKLFFQPGYYLLDFKPILFIAGKTMANSTFLEIIDQKCKQQGFPGIIIFETDLAPPGYTRWVTGNNNDLGQLIMQWRKDYIEDKNPAEIHLLTVSTGAEEEDLSRLSTAEKFLQGAEDYSIASFLYRKQQEIAECKHQLYLKTVSEKNTQLYLSIQKDERANGLKWYYNEYEVLPRWYKKFGHIIKVLMGKRTFKSLFSDKVKKYKD